MSFCKRPHSPQSKANLFFLEAVLESVGRKTGADIWPICAPNRSLYLTKAPTKSLLSQALAGQKLSRSIMGAHAAIRSAPSRRTRSASLRTRSCRPATLAAPRLDLPRVDVVTIAPPHASRVSHSVQNADEFECRRPARLGSWTFPLACCLRWFRTADCSLAALFHTHSKSTSSRIPGA
jgi:hypothetical protein